MNKILFLSVKVIYCKPHKVKGLSEKQGYSFARVCVIVLVTLSCHIPCMYHKARQERKVMVKQGKGNDNIISMTEACAMHPYVHPV